MNKKGIFVTSFLIFISFLFSFSVCAEGKELEGGEQFRQGSFIFEKIPDWDEVILLRLEGESQEEVVVPSEVLYEEQSFSVREIDDGAFFNQRNLKKITLPDSVFSLGDRCFSGCVQLEELNLPESIHLLGEKCFFDCQNLSRIGNFHKVAKIGNRCFMNCFKLENVCLPETLTELGEGCFQNCTGLQQVQCPKNLETLKKDCFQWCTSLREISLPERLACLEDSCFSYCRSLQRILLPSTVKVLGKRCFHNCEQLKELLLPDGMMNIGDFCFSACAFQRMSLPDSIVFLGKGCFYGCYSLEYVRLPAGIQSVDEEFFRGCDKVKPSTEFFDKESHEYAKMQEYLIDSVQKVDQNVRDLYRKLKRFDENYFKEQKSWFYEKIQAQMENAFGENGRLNSKKIAEETSRAELTEMVSEAIKLQEFLVKMDKKVNDELLPLENLIHT